MKYERPDPEAILAGLKDFQRDTARYAFRRMYLDERPSHRFLVADEVGLGKTMVARGVIAQAIDHLWETDVERIDVIYVCSNQDIAQQNINRLGLDFGDCKPRATRITMLPSELAAMKQKGRVNLVSFTPATSFDLASSTGMASERALLGGILQRLLGDAISTTRLINTLHAERNRTAFEGDFTFHKAEVKKLDDSFLERFECELTTRGLVEQFTELTSHFTRQRINRPPRELIIQRNLVIGRLREALARVCLDSLEPDLIILDEFQRFRHLLSEDSDAGRLAHGLFNYTSEHNAARVLLLSATPYKMYTLAEEESGEDHYQDFLQTADFLFKDKCETDELKSDLDSYRVSLFNLETVDRDELSATRDRIQSRLLGVMTRTERVAWTHEHDAMVETIHVGSLAPEAEDFLGYRRLQRVASEAKQYDAVEFWKSIPYPLSFMAEYRLRTEVELALGDPHARPDLTEAVRAARGSFLNAQDVRDLNRISSDGARLRWLIAEVARSGLDAVPWLPPTMPYYRPQGPWKSLDARTVTKLLLFSAWRAVPRGVASLLSHEVRRRLLCKADVPESIRDRSHRPMQFGRLKDHTGVERPSLMTWLYPSPTLARECDPLRTLWSEPARRGVPTLQDAYLAAKRVLLPLVAEAEGAYSVPDGDSRIWSWAAPALIDALEEPARTLDWVENHAAAAWSQGDDVTTESAAAASRYLAAVIRREVAIGPAPRRTPEVLARIALGSPAVCAVRALRRVPETRDADSLEVMTGAARIADAFRTLFNQPETYAMVLASECDARRPYWRRSLAFAAAGGLQAMLDEYVHVLRESEGLQGKDASRVIGEITARICEAVALPASQLKADVVEPGDGDVQMLDARMLCKFAMPFGIRVEASDDATRGRRLREGFNSPFWPFVLVSTSIGQEGLDFHWYCHAVAHWNLPQNPVDLEQREGRVHRYKGLAIRKNVARRHARASLMGVASNGNDDPWEAAFATAAAARDESENDLTPYWLYPLKRESGDSCVIRYLPNLPLSRDVERAESLSRALGAYRLAFGQPRQEDLVSFLLAADPNGILEADLSGALVDLRPDVTG